MPLAISALFVMLVPVNKGSIRKSTAIETLAPADKLAIVYVLSAKSTGCEGYFWSGRRGKTSAECRYHFYYYYYYY